MDNPLHESPRHFNQNFNSEFFNRFASLPSSELPGMSSSVKNEVPDTRLPLVFCSPRCLVFVQLDPDHPGSPPFWNKVYNNQELNLTTYYAFIICREHQLNCLHHLTPEMPYSAFFDLNEPNFFSSPHAEDALLAVMVLMDTTGYQAVTVEMEPKVRWA